MAEQAPALLAVRQRDAPEPRPVDAGDAVVACEPLVDEGVVGVEQIQHAAVLVQGAGQEQRGLLPERLDQVVVEVGERYRVAGHVLQVAQVQPLDGEVVDERPRARLGQHAPDLRLQHRRGGQRALLGRIEQRLVRDAAPEEERQARGDLHVAQAVRLSGGGTGGVAFHAQEEIGVDEHPLQRELDTGVEAAAVLPAAVEEAEQRVQVVRRHRPAVGAPRQPRDDIGGAGSLVLGRRGLRPAREDEPPARRVADPGDGVRPADGRPR